MSENENASLDPTPVADPPHGIASDHNPPAKQTPAPIVDRLARFDAEVSKAENQPSRAMQALKLGELVEQQLPEEMRAIYTQLRYETYPKSEGGLGLQVDFRRNPHSAQQLDNIRREARKLIRAKRIALEHS